MKPNIKFLEKVELGEVAKTFGYSKRKGGHYGFVGGEATYFKHLKAGLVNPAPPASLGRRGIVTLTDAGREALRTSQDKGEPTNG